MRRAARSSDPTPAPSGGGELLAKLAVPRAGTASRCDRFLSEVLLSRGRLWRLPNPGHQNERRGLGGRGSLSEWNESRVVARCRRECLLCLSWLCCLGVGVKSREAALPSHTLVAALPGVTIPGLRSCPLALLQLQGWVHHAKIGVDCSIEAELCQCGSRDSCWGLLLPP